jgi:4'-phosphopantetheinyl transferase
MISDSHSQDDCWCDGPPRLKLGNDEVHVWRAMLSVGQSVLQSLHSTLSPDERTKVERFYFPKDRDRSIAARAVLRLILSRYLEVEPAQLRFCYNRFGKPALIGHSGADTLHFNMSHSGELALYAIARGREIGVDVEHVREDFASEQIAERFFSPSEVAMLHALPFNMRTRGFFNCWTRKEAYIKARGEGLSLPLDRFDVSLTPGEPAALLRVSESKPEVDDEIAGDGKLEASRWSLRELSPGPCYAAAIAVQGYGWQLKCWQWT